MWRNSANEKGMRHIFSAIAALFALTSAYVWDVGQTGVGTFNRNVCELLRRHAPVPEDCGIDNWILALWAALVAVSVIYLLWQVSRWIWKHIGDLNSTIEGAQSETSTPLQAVEAALAEEMRLFQSDLVIRNIWFQVAHLDSENILHINIDMTNSTREPVNLIRIEGNIFVSKDIEGKSPYKLTPPQLSHHRISQFPPGQDFSFILSQEVPSQFVRDWQNATYNLDFRNLNIVMQSVANSNKIVRLPAIGDHANPANRKALAQPIDHGDQAAGISGVPGPHLGAHQVWLSWILFHGARFQRYSVLSGCDELHLLREGAARGSPHSRTYYPHRAQGILQTAQWVMQRLRRYYQEI